MYLEAGFPSCLKEHIWPLYIGPKLTPWITTPQKQVHASSIGLNQNTSGPHLIPTLPIF